ncbi:DUF4287 domain-containing protein [Pedobacter glucosidilyticus]|uniref:DUF4287 domain-containing protein n=1 Tax=Pedobacter glucosidilyticus TaxID=1122941 RepID=UPI0003F5DC27|nr:DUF4287 domain-containing protein [Pedobacter glucosidilyticus]
MNPTTETLMTAIEENTGHPLEYWIETIRKSGKPDCEEIINFLITKHQLNPLLAELIAQKAKGNS